VAIGIHRALPGGGADHHAAAAASRVQFRLSAAFRGHRGQLVPPALVRLPGILPVGVMVDVENVSVHN